jgi:hypothetical protein
MGEWWPKKKTKKKKKEDIASARSCRVGSHTFLTFAP